MNHTTTLFPLVEPARIPAIRGLSYLSCYISEAEEAKLIDAIDALPWDASWKRRRQPFGATYGREQATAPPLPAWGRDLAERMCREGLVDDPFDQMLGNEYLPGQGIALHRDYEPFDRTVASLSLLSPCVMEFRSLADHRRESLLLERRSLLIFSDDARYLWQHGIAPRKNDLWRGVRFPRGRRVSVTFRLLKRRTALSSADMH